MDSKLLLPNLLFQRQTWDFPIPIHYGPGVRHELADLCKATAISAPLVVTDRGSQNLPFISEILDLLKCGGLSPTFYSDVNSYPTEQNVAGGIDAFLRFGVVGDPQVNETVYGFRARTS